MVLVVVRRRRRVGALGVRSVEVLLARRRRNVGVQLVRRRKSVGVLVVRKTRSTEALLE